MNRERLTTWLLLAMTFAVRAIHPGQPIVENYVGRQVPTAMVARNLERGSGFLHPTLDTGPFPNLFLVEPPIYARVVASARIFGFDWETTGRLTSAAATTLAAWGLFGLARRREGLPIAWLALASFNVFPVMIRYGRAFQPDALMLGCVLAGLRAWDEFETTGDRGWAWIGGFVLSIGLALKVTVAWALIPYVLMVTRWPLAWRMAASVAMLLPALAWYGWAWGDVEHPGGGSLASSDNAGYWVRSLSPTAWLRFSTYDHLAKGLLYRSFTLVGFVLAAWGLLASGKLDRIWVGWGAGSALSIAVLASKWHHAYYWVVVAPLAAVGVARGLARLAHRSRSGPLTAAGLGSIFLAACVAQSWSTWQTPVEWAGIVEAGHAVAQLAPAPQLDLVVAPEALLYYADRRGYRLEFDAEAARRAAGECGGSLRHEGPLALVEFYRTETTNGDPGSFRKVDPGPGIVADCGPTEPGSARDLFRSAIRADPHYLVLIDRTDLLISKYH